MTNKQSVHHTFQNVCADQEYRISDIINELTRLKNSCLSGLEHSQQSRKSAMENGTPLHSGKCTLSDRFVETHNALLVAERWQGLGMKTIKLNSMKSMQDQILAKAKPEDTQYKYDSEFYQKKLG